MEHPDDRTKSHDLLRRIFCLSLLRLERTSSMVVCITVCLCVMLVTLAWGYRVNWPDPVGGGGVVLPMYHTTDAHRLGL